MVARCRASASSSTTIGTAVASRTPVITGLIATRAPARPAKARTPRTSPKQLSIAWPGVAAPCSPNRSRSRKSGSSNRASPVNCSTLAKRRSSATRAMVRSASVRRYRLASGRTPAASPVPARARPNISRSASQRPATRSSTTALVNHAVPTGSPAETSVSSAYQVVSTGAACQVSRHTSAPAASICRRSRRAPIGPVTPLRRWGTP